MANQELKGALKSINKVLTDLRVNSGQRDQLLKARRELEKLARTGKLERRKVFRAVQMIADVLVEIAATEVAQRPE
jgi:hypothetical protein